MNLFTGGSVSVVYSQQWECLFVTIAEFKVDWQLYMHCIHLPLDHCFLKKLIIYPPSPKNVFETKVKRNPVLKKGFFKFWKNWRGAFCT